MKRLSVLAAAVLASCTTPSSRPLPPPVAVAPAPTPIDPADDAARMQPTATILANTAAATSLVTLTKAIKATGLDASLAMPTEMTLFAPTDQAFARFAPGVVNRLLAPDNRDVLLALLRYHLVAGRITAQDLAQRIAAGGGTATLVTIGGQPITATLTGKVITLTSVTGNRSYVEVPDLPQANGVIHIVNGVLVPTFG